MGRKKTLKDGKGKGPREKEKTTLADKKFKRAQSQESEVTKEGSPESRRDGTDLDGREEKGSL